MTRILVVPGSYKSTFKSIYAARRLGDALETTIPDSEVTSVVLADGGEGTLECFQLLFGGDFAEYKVSGPLGSQLSARVLWLSRSVAVVESAEVVGYSLLSLEDRDPWRASSYGVGELLGALIAQGAAEIYVTMGDSIIMDMGIGMLSALGVQFRSGNSHLPRPTLRELPTVTELHIPHPLLPNHVRVHGLVDTVEPILGSNGQAAVYGAQKGLAPSEAPAVEAAHVHLDRLVFSHLGIRIGMIPMGTGSGGLAGALACFLGAKLEQTLEYLDAKVGLTKLIDSAEIVITGEGRLDGQSRWGKVPYWVGSRARGSLVLLVGEATKEAIAHLRIGSVANLHCVEMGVGTFDVEEQFARGVYRVAVVASSLIRLPGVLG